MDIQLEKKEIIKKVLSTSNSVIISQIKHIFEDENDNDFWFSLIEKQKAEIKSGINELDKGQRYSYEEVTKKYR